MLRLLRFSLLLPALLIAAFALSGCESSEEKAERYYQSGLSLLAAGDEDRAMVEFRNVFKYNGFHKEARQSYAAVLQKRGEITEAYSQYLRLIEQYPDTADVRLILAETAIGRSDWPEAERHGQAAIALAPDLPGVQAVRLALWYRAAILERDEARRSEIAQQADALLQSHPDNAVARRVVIDRLINSDTPLKALPQIDAALQSDPASLEFHMLKFRLLAQADDIAGTGAQLQTMFTQFPENEQVRSALINWYLLQNDLDGAESFLRSLAGDATADAKGHVAVVQLLRSVRGTEAAAAELDRLAALNAGSPNAELYEALRASLSFESGQTTEAIAAMKAILASAEVSDQTRRLRGMLAVMLDNAGDRAGAKELVEAILKEDPSSVATLKLRASWLIDEDQPSLAIIDLRTALDQAPRDPEILTLMASAHEREGDLDLASERLALAVSASGSAAPEALRYAQFLTRKGRFNVAETVLQDALRVNPSNPDILIPLADLFIQRQSWAEAQMIVDDLRKAGLSQADVTLQSLQAAILLGQNRTEDSLAFLESLAAQSVGSTHATAMIVQTQIRSGRTDEARKTLEEALAKTPDDPGLRILNGSLQALSGDIATAEATYRGIIRDLPGSEVPVQLLYGLLRAANRDAEALSLLDDALVAMPGSATLRWIKAGALERAEDFEAAIAVYEQLYAEDSGNTVVANNLASLISAHRTDAASLERAYTIARRLRGSEVPAFQDTYGWIEYRRGNLEEARQNLSAAAAGLPNDPLTQFHFGMVLADLGQSEAAIQQFERVLDLAGDTQLPQFAVARQRLDVLRTQSKKTTP